jgi:hypothetical protein
MPPSRNKLVGRGSARWNHEGNPPFVLDRSGLSRAALRIVAYGRFARKGRRAKRRVDAQTRQSSMTLDGCQTEHTRFLACAESDLAELDDGE